jgi:hypothetical protein
MSIRPEFEQWLRAAADAVAAVRRVPDTLLPELAQTQPQHTAPVSMQQLEQQAQAANTMLCDCCRDTQGPRGIRSSSTSGATGSP